MPKETGQLDSVATLASVPLQPFGNGGAFECHEGEYRFGGGTRTVRAGDVLGAPCGGAEFAHRLTNTGTEPLKYLAISSKFEADVCEYPDSGKFWAGSGVDGERFGFVGRLADRRDYWERESE